MVRFQLWTPKIEMNSKEYTKEASRKSYLKNKDKVLERTHKRRAEARVWCEQIKSVFKCVVCGEGRQPCIDFHHINPEEKEGSLSNIITKMYNKEKALKEIKKCVSVCSNCHRLIHANQLILEKSQIDLMQSFIEKAEHLFI